MTRKSISLLLAIVMILAFFAGCSNEPAATSTPPATNSTAPNNSDTPAPPIVENGYTAPVGWPLADGDVAIEWWFSLSADVTAYIADFENNYAWNTLERLSGVDITLTTPESSTEAEKFNLLIVSEDYPDIMRMLMTGYPGGGDKSINDGVFLRLNELVEQYAPNYQRWRGYTEEIAKTTVTDAGNMYQMQMIFDTRQAVIFGNMIRQDWLDDLGLAMPKTVNQWRDVLISFRNNKTADGYGPLSIGATGFGTFETFNGSAWGIGGSGEALSFILKDGKVAYSGLQPELRDYLETMNAWYSEGLIDTDFTTNAQAQRELVANDKIGAAAMIFVLGDKFWANSVGNDEMFWSLCPFVVKQEGDIPLHGNLRDQSPVDTGLCVSAETPYAEICVQLMDYYYSEAGALLANYGIENVTFDYNSDGKPVLRDLITANPNGLSVSAAQALYLVHSGAMVFMLGREEDTMLPAALEYKTLWNSEFPRQLPGSLSYTEEEATIISTYMNDMTTYLQENACRFITGTKPFSEYDSFVQGFIDMGIDRVVAVKQASYNRYQNR